MKRLHPLSLLVFALWLSSMAIALSSLAELAGIVFISALARGILTGFCIGSWLRQFIKTLPLFAAVLVIQVLFVKEGDLLVGSGWYAVHSQAVVTAIGFFLRLLILIYTAQTLLKLDYEDFDQAFNAIRMPEELCFMLFYALHIIPLLAGRIKHFRLLLVTRGIEIRKLTLNKKLWIYKTLSLTLIADILSRSAVQAMALDLRGFRSPGMHTRLVHRSFSALDLTPLGVILLVSALYIAL